MKASITGINGFIGGALNRRLLELGWETFSYIRPDVDYVFLFGSPSSNILFDRNLDRCMSQTIDGFLDAIRYCRDLDIKLVYPSSATVHNKNTTYARCKAALEEIQLAYNTDVLGLRIYAGYGVGEGHKKDYASIIYQFCQQMKNGEQPIIYGDGSQTRDFIYIDDIISYIVQLIYDESKPKGIIDVGSGHDTSFNEIVNLINIELGTKIKPIYIDKPSRYVADTHFEAMDFQVKYGRPKVNIQEGIRRTLNDQTM